MIKTYEDWENSLDQNYVRQLSPDAWDLTGIAFEAGQQSQQAKIDELQKQVITQGQNFNDQAQKLKDTEYFNQKLQARVEKALYHLDFNHDNDKDIAINILKGNKDEN